MAGVPAKLRTAVIVLLCLVGLLAGLYCVSLESLLLKVMLHGHIIKISFAGSRDHTVCSPLRSGCLNSMIQINAFQ
jgi:hypothetical protein